MGFPAYRSTRQGGCNYARGGAVLLFIGGDHARACCEQCHKFATNEIAIGCNGAAHRKIHHLHPDTCSFDPTEDRADCGDCAWIAECALKRLSSRSYQASLSKRESCAE